jgi:BirA family biotin operon repressor/biotin-[acetyl-CoA-carboxylase] ligase
MLDGAKDKGEGLFSAPWPRGGVTAYVAGESTSSLDAAWALARKGLLSPWESAVAVSQSGGRGRLRRPWASPPGNLYAAIRLPWMGKAWREISALFCGFFAARALAALGVDVQVKWPNDLLLGGGKAGGILVEERGEDCVVGIGINVAGDLPGFAPREAWSPEPAWLQGFLKPQGLPELLSALVKSGQRCYDEFVASGPPERFLPVFEKRLSHLNQTVMVRETCSGEPAYAAKILGLLPDGALLIESEGKRMALRSGSISPA